MTRPPLDSWPEIVADKEEEICELRARLGKAEAVVDAARKFRDWGTVLTVCNRGACQRVIEHRDNSDPQAILFGALRAYDNALMINPHKPEERSER